MKSVHHKFDGGTLRTRTCDAAGGLKSEINACKSDNMNLKVRQTR